MIDPVQEKAMITDLAATDEYRPESKNNWEDVLRIQREEDTDAKPA